jgi:hypothetical protein
MEIFVELEKEQGNLVFPMMLCLIFLSCTHYTQFFMLMHIICALTENAGWLMLSQYDQWDRGSVM